MKMTKYEIMYIIRPTVLEDDRKALIEELNEIFTSRNSRVDNVNEWGMRDLAYEIQKHRKGYYVVLDVVATEEARAEFDRVVRIKEDIIRYLIIKDER
jgi:small subunit ribosomal protein S6